MMISSIPDAAALQVFADVWAQYSALLEADQILMNGTMDDVIHVEQPLRLLFPLGASRNRIRTGLITDPEDKRLKSTRIALGQAFQAVGLWPTKAYFSQ